MRSKSSSHFGIFHKVNKPTKNEKEAKINKSLQSKVIGPKDWQILQKKIRTDEMNFECGGKFQKPKRPSATKAVFSGSSRQSGLIKQRNQLVFDFRLGFGDAFFVGARDHRKVNQNPDTSDDGKD